MGARPIANRSLDTERASVSRQLSRQPESSAIKPVGKLTRPSRDSSTRRTPDSAARRRGFEAEWDADLGHGITAHVNYSYILAEFAEPYTSGITPVVTPAGSRLPGVPPQQVFGVLEWRPGGYYGFSAAAEVQYVGICSRQQHRERELHWFGYRRRYQ